MKSRRLTTRGKVLTFFIVVLGTPVLLAALLLVYFRRYPPLNRDWVVTALEKRYLCEVELKSLTVTLVPSLSIVGEGLLLKRKEGAGLPPLANINKFSLQGEWLALLRHPRHFGQVRLEGLVIVVPPRGKEIQAGKSQPELKGQQELPEQQVSSFVLDEVLAEGAKLSILSANRSKPPHEFEIHRLRMRSAGPGQPMSFEVTLTNPTPVGQVQSSGQFGPWNADDPSLTPVSGTYSFSHAELSTLRGLGGTLSSHGSYQGVLSEIQVHGETDTPDFDLGISGNRLHLKTEFSALVDGVNGDTLLRPVSAQLLESKVVARGGVAQEAVGKGRIILLDVSAQPARLEDLLRLAVKSTVPSMTGMLNAQTKFDLHPGEEEIAKRLKLDGSFTVQSGRFTNPATEAKIAGLSRRGQGKPRDEDIQNVQFDAQGQFALLNGEVTFSRLAFSVPGASVELQGTFGLLSQALDFHGTLRLQAKISQTTSGIKSLLLKPIDRLFEREGAGTVLPIKILGTRGEPSIKVEIGKILKRED